MSYLPITDPFVVRDDEHTDPWTAIADINDTLEGTGYVVVQLPRLDEHDRFVIMFRESDDE